MPFTMIAWKRDNLSGKLKKCIINMVGISFHNRIAPRLTHMSGPIVRIRPDVIHINDPDFIDQLYAGASKRRDKYKIACNGFATPGAALGTIDHDLHRSRRAALNPFFSKQSVRRLEPIVQEALGKVLDRFSQHAKTGSPISVSLLYSALTSDIINNYAFGPSESALEQPDLNEPHFRAFIEAAEGYHITCYLPFLPKLYATLPLPVVKLMFPKVTVFVDLIGVRQPTLLTGYSSDAFIETKTDNLTNKARKRRS